jgi:hypothetical protein
MCQNPVCSCDNLLRSLVPQGLQPIIEHDIQQSQLIADHDRVVSGRLSDRSHLHG